MTAIRKDMFGDGLVSMEYYPHRRIELRVCGFKIDVCKPYGVNIGGYKTIDKPAIAVSANQTVHLDMVKMQLIQKSIIRAIDILNSENDGLIIDKNFTFANYNSVYNEDIPSNIKALHQQSNEQVKTKSIPYKYITSDKVYEDIRGHKWIYLGKGRLYENGIVSNRGGCEYIYLDFDKICNIKWVQQGNIIILDTNEILLVDSYASKKRFIREVSKLSNTVNKVVMPHVVFRFEERI